MLKQLLAALHLVAGGVTGYPGRVTFRDPASLEPFLLLERVELGR